MKRLNIKNPFSDAPLYYREETGSTMEDCKKDSIHGIIHGSVYQAGFQSKGRGRIKGRKWISSSGNNLLFTVVLKRSCIAHEIYHMPLITGVALAEAVSEYTNYSFKLKWPNDLLFNGKKTAGILCEADDTYFYGGIGVNCNQAKFPESLQAATSLLQISGAEIDLSALLLRILEKIKYYSGKDNLWRENFDKILYKKGEMIEIREGQAVEGTLIRGKNLGIGSDGQLLIECKEGNIEEIYAGEIEK